MGGRTSGSHPTASWAKGTDLRWGIQTPIRRLNPITVDGYPPPGTSTANSQQAATLWFHDHTLGATRINVYAGMAAFYLLRDSWDDGQGGTGKLPGGPYEREIAIQDRQFNTNGQLIFPDSLAAMGLNGCP